ncbi:hypothetical protein PR048_006270 [Dryococelus australis]|uniref:Uncharacterized protein n=1 Tax=Dryococelus australis TaxID=614101 RepID=A0ABQ9IAG8_9NEOP|nr:hypothetical protein PR048_006270 [Dryococelus australis]
MQEILEGAPGVVSNANDILIYRATPVEHNARVEERKQALRELLKKENEWIRGTVQKEAVHKLKEEISK